MATGMPMNCWEFVRCGREPGGNRAEKLGVCPTAVARPLHGVHGGVNGGRACWTVAGTMSSDRKPVGNVACKLGNCRICLFLQPRPVRAGRESDERFRAPRPHGPAAE
ncbi:MAG: hypothetical protein M5R36_10445 [Deltaproteobacteria bacterium]|nr:hypothetical protein [Deltaproteobacteria bacterium]